VSIPEGAADVTTASHVAQAAAAVSAVADFAVDVEADAMHHFRSRLCWVQVGTEKEIFLFDTLLPEVKLDALAADFANPLKTKFFHAAMGDLQYLAEVGVRVKGLFDTHRAATLLGWPKVGLADLVLEKLGKVLAKEHQQSDFSLRPFPPELRSYIADDVRYLVEVGRSVREACVTADILEEVELDCQRIADEAAERPDVNGPYKFKLPTQGVSHEQQRLSYAVAQWLHQLRLQLAEAEDIPMGRMLSNTAIVTIATKVPKAIRELGRLEGVRGAFTREHGEKVLQKIVELSEQNAKGELAEPTETKERDPKKRRRSEALGEWRKQVATQRKVTPSVVLPNPLIEDVAAANPGDLEALAVVPYFGAKRLALYGPEVLAAMKQHR
jgi:ribonuclease D